VHKILNFTFRNMIKDKSLTVLNLKLDIIICKFKIKILEIKITHSCFLFYRS